MKSPVRVYYLGVIAVKGIHFGVHMGLENQSHHQIAVIGDYLVSEKSAKPPVEG
jgi:hypothetical protein